MGRPRTPELAAAFALAAAAVTTSAAAPARANRNDLHLLNLCPPSSGGTCSWVAQSGGVTSVDLAMDPDATSRFRSLMSELGVVIAPRLQTPADTLGFAGFQFSAELGFTNISRDQAFWNGVEGVDPGNPAARRPDNALTTVGAFVRKGMWFPIPALEWGAGGVNVLESGMWAIQAYVKLAIQEGFQDWVMPSFAVRAGVSRLVGTDQVTLTVGSLDALISKAVSVAGTARVEPFLGADFLFIDARSGVIDATPGCDAVALHQTNPADAVAVAALPPGCPTDQAGTWADLGANFTFPHQDVITRYQLYAGVKVKVAMLFAAAQVAVAPPGRSRDHSSETATARDGSSTQTSIGISGGVDY